MNLKYKKSNLVEGMGYKQILPTFYGKKPQNIKLTESQFKRLVGGYMEEEDDELYEMNLGDDDGGNLPPGVDDETDNFNQQLEECGEDEIYKDSEGEEIYHYGEDESADKREEGDLEAHLQSLRSDIGYDQYHE